MDYFSLFCISELNSVGRIKEQFRVKAADRVMYMDKQLFDKPFPCKVGGEESLFGDCLSKEELKSYFTNKERVEELKYNIWLLLNKLFDIFENYEGKGEIFDQINDYKKYD